MENCKEWFYVVLALIGLILFLVAMFMNYNLKLDRNQVKLAKELKEVERVNGKEKQDIKELQEKTQFLEKKLQKYERQ